MTGPVGALRPTLARVERSARPPAYAWDWFARQRLLWRRVRQRLAVGGHPSASRYRATETKSDVMALLRAEYERDDTVRAAVHDVVSEIVFLGRTDVPFERLGVRTPPRGMRWWWTALTGEQLDAPAEPDAPGAQQLELTLEEVQQGIGG